MRYRRLSVVAVGLVGALTAAAAAGSALLDEPQLITPALYRSTAPSSAHDPNLAQVDREWLDAGSVPGRGTAWEAMATAALLDLRAYVDQNGAVAAGPGGPWRYTWPRDASFVGLALARTGHPAQARAVFGHLAELELSSAGFAARYHADGTPVRDGRPAQSDGCGWVLWALAGAEAADPDSLPATASSLRERCTDTLLRLVRDGRSLPPPSQDYWELPVDGLTLGVAAPVLAGLRSVGVGTVAALVTAGRDGAHERDPGARAERAAVAANRLAALVEQQFGPAFERYGDRGGWDAAVAVLMPPFTTTIDQQARGAWLRYQREARRPAGGLAPGSGWEEHSTSWTPETALVAYTAAASGEKATAVRLVNWLDRHRTAYGSLPEKVTKTGRPAGPAPLLWTSAMVLLTLDELESAG